MNFPAPRLCLALAAALTFRPVSASAADTPEQAAANAKLSFDGIKLRVLAPAKRKGRAPALTASYGNLYPDNFVKEDGSYGASGGLEFEFPLNSRGTDLTAGAVFFDSYKAFPDGSGGWKQDRVRSFPLTVGVRQRLLRAGLGTEDGRRGVFLEPTVGAGINPLTGVTRFSGPSEEPEPYANGSADYHRLRPSPYVSGGVRVNAGARVSAGVELRRYWVVAEPSGAHGGTQLTATVTLSPKSR